MTRDYKAKRRPARGGGGFSGWVGLVCGLGLGLAIAAFIYIKDHRPDAALAHVAKTDKKKPRAGTNDPPDIDGGDAGGQEESAKSYSFYDQLPRFEVVVPEKEKDVRPDNRAVPETRRGSYVLQAGSYKNFADADRVRAQLALQGIESKVQKVSVDNDTWLRVRIGPISNLEELNRMRTILRKADVDVLVIRVGD
jgi:cell division protein FtsN